MGGLIKHNLLPKDTEERIFAFKIYEFNRNYNPKNRIPVYRLLYP